MRDLNYENTTVSSRQERQKSNRFNEQNSKSARTSRFFVHFVAVPALIRRAGNDQILSLLENGNGKPINSTISGIIAPEKVKGCEVYFSGMFSWTSLLYSVAVGIEES